MFNDKFGLTSAVLNGTKTMTRRILKVPITEYNAVNCALNDDENLEANKLAIIKKYARYQEGEIVAVAQSYRELIEQGYFRNEHGLIPVELCECGGYRNKMFVNADLMPHHIHTTGIKVERLQDISEDDALREGIFHYEQPPLHHKCDRFAPWPPYVKPYKHDNDNLKYRCTARFAFAYLIDKVSGTGTWNTNPWVLGYTFELAD